MKRKIELLLAFLLLSISCAFAQKLTIKGTVLDETGQTIIGATIREKGVETNGAATNLDGQFTLTVNQGATIIVSYVGYKTQEVKAAAQLTIKMVPDNELLDEVVVVAYGSARKSSLTGATSVVDAKKLESRPLTSVTKALEGSSTGVLTTSGSGQPGSNPTVIIRGFGSINASSNPLYVVDGMPFDGDLSSINPSDITSFSILKDASAAALYGSRAANGVVLITTKKGKEGNTRITWRSTVGWSNRALKEYETVGMEDFISLTWQSIYNDAVLNGKKDPAAIASGDLEYYLSDGVDGGELYNPFRNKYKFSEIVDPSTHWVRPDAGAPLWNERWFDEVQNKNALRHEHQFSLSGGTENLKYMMSLGYVNEEGIVINTGYDRLNARLNLENRVSDWFTASLNGSYSLANQKFSQFTGTSGSNVWYTAFLMPSIYPVYLKDKDGKTYTDSTGNRYDYGEQGNGWRPVAAGQNSIAGMTDDPSTTKSDNAGLRTQFVIGSDKESAGWLQGLKLTIGAGGDYRTRNGMDYYNMLHGNQAGTGLLYRRSNRMLSYTINELLTWNRTFDERHSFDFMVGHEYYDYSYRNLEGARKDLVFGNEELTPGATVNTADSYSHRYVIESYLSRLNYSFEDKYHISASWRTDGSSRFEKDHRWGNFWSLGGSWNMSKEAFMSDLKWLNALTLRASYGEQGNDMLLDDYGYPMYYAWQGILEYGWPNAYKPGGIVTKLENKELSWEKNGSFNAGIDFAILDHRITGSVDYFNKSTKDMLLVFPKALSTGFEGYNENIGDMVNYGVEMELTVKPVSNEKVDWGITWMGSVVNNKVLKLTGLTDEIISGNFIIKEGMPVNTFYMPKFAGVNPDNGAVLYWAYKDKDGKEVDEYKTEDISVASNNKYYLGSRLPKIYGSLSTQLSLFSIVDFSMLTTYSVGGKVLDYLYNQLMNPMYYANNFHKDVLKAWQKPGQVTDVPRVYIDDKRLTHSGALIDASYFAIKNITLGVSVPRKYLESVKISKARVFASMDNVALFTHLQGMDPQYNFSGTTDYSYSPNKTFSMGVELNF